MSIFPGERTKLREFNPFSHGKAIDELAEKALASIVSIDDEISSTSPAIISRIEEIKKQPIEEIDISLKSLIALSHDETLASDTGEIPVVLTDAIHATAERMVEEWDGDDYNQAAVAGLAEAYAITHDTTLIEKATEVIDTHPLFTKMVPQVEEAVRYAADNGDELDSSFKAITPYYNQSSLPMQLRSASASTPELINDWAEQIPMEEYESLFHPTERRPSTPEYSGRYDPSLRPEHWPPSQ